MNLHRHQWEFQTVTHIDEMWGSAQIGSSSDVLFQCRACGKVKVKHVDKVKVPVETAERMSP